MTTPIDYAATHFQHVPLTRVIGEPTYSSLKQLKDELKANAQTVPSNLGNGQSGLLGLIMSPQEYIDLTNVPFILPPHAGTSPVALNNPDAQGARTYAAMLANWKEANRVWQETHSVEQALLNQLVAALDPVYVKPLRDTATQRITVTLHEVLEYLFTTYGRVDDLALQAEESKVNTLVWNLADPPVLIYNAIEELRELGSAARIHYSTPQLINFGIRIIRKSTDLEQALIRWDNRPAGEKTWENFKTHFTAAHNELRRIRGPTMRNSTFQQAHEMIEQVNETVMGVRDDVITRIEALAEIQESDPDTSIRPNDAALVDSMNATTNTNQELTRLLQTINSQLSNMQICPPITNNGGRGSYGGYNYGGRGGRGQGRGIGRGGRGGYRPRRNFSLYCHTHGSCAHSSRDCFNPGNGHRNDATFNNQMGGSQYGITNSNRNNNNNNNINNNNNNSE